MRTKLLLLLGRFAVLGVIVTASCTKDQPNSVPFIARDSAGIAIVESEAHLLRPEECWTVANDPFVTIGEVDGPSAYNLSSPWAARLSDGRIVILDRQSKELRLFSAAGRHLSSAGREGDGPGELRNPQTVEVVQGDTLVIWDVALRRISLFDPAGSFAHSVNLEGSEYIQLAIGVLGSDSWLGKRGLPSRDSAGLYLHRNEIIVLADRGQSRFPVDTVSEPRFVSSSHSTFLPFGANPFLVAGAGRAFVYRGANYEVSVYDETGRLVQVLRRSWSPEPVTEDDIQVFLDWMLSQGNRAQRARFTEQNEQAARKGKYKPPIRWMFVDRLGNLWAAPWAQHGEMFTEFDVFDTAGRWLCTVTVPEELWMITDVGDDYVLGVGSDDLGVARVSVYELSKPEEPKSESGSAPVS